MKIILSFLFTLAPIFAAAIPVKQDCVQSVCSFTYTPPTTAACTLAVTDNSGLVPSVNDVNASLFTGANTDTSRTAAAGFKWPTLKNPDGSRTLFIGGNGGSRLAADSKWYTYGLQNNTPHTLTLTCAGGSSVTVVPFATKNVPMGNFYPEPPPTNSTQPYNWEQPTIDWASNSTSYILDHGILVRRISNPTDFLDSLQFGQTSTHAFDLSSAWTLPANPPDTTHLASTSTANAPLFLAFPHTNIQPDYGNGFEYFTDILLHLFGHGTGTAHICISTDSGQSAASGCVDQALTGVNTTYNLPPGYPSNMFTSWGLATKPLGNWDLANIQLAGVSTSGHVVTTFPSGVLQFLNVDRPNGSKFQLSGCSGGTGNGYYTVNTVDSLSQITAIENIGTATGCVYTDLGAGFRVTLAGSGNLNISATYDAVSAVTLDAGSNSSQDLFNFNKVSVSVDCDGVTRNPPIGGRLGVVGSSGGSRVPVYLFQDDGRVCLQSGTYVPTVGYVQVPQNPFSATDPLKFMATWSGNLQLGTLNSCCTAYNPAPWIPPSNDNVSYVNQTGANPPLTTQLASLGGSAATHFAKGLWTTPTLAATIGGYTIYNSTPIGAGGDVLMLRLRTDLTGHLVQAFTSFDQDPGRWICVHISPIGADNILLTGGNACGAFNNAASLAGPWGLQFNSVHKGAAGFTTHNLAPSTCTATNPIVCTATAHGLDEYLIVNAGFGIGRGHVCTISGLTGGWAALNGTRMCVSVGNAASTVGNQNTFSVYNVFTSATIDGTGFGSFPGGGVFGVGPQVVNYRVGAITAANPAVVTTIDAAVGIIPSSFEDGDPIGIDGFNNTQFYWHVIDGSHGSLYLDQAFTTPVDNTGGAFNGAVNFGIYSAETCPGGLATKYTSDMLFDGVGAVGVRCITFKGLGPCSYFAATGEQAHYPCPSDPANTQMSQLQDIIEGDSISDARDGFFENMRLVKKVDNGDGTFNYTFMRFFGKKYSASVPGSGDNRSTSASHQNTHQYGWLPVMIPTQTVSGFGTVGGVDVTDATNSWTMIDGRIPNHTEIGYGTPGLFTYTGGNGSDSVANVPFNFFNGFVVPNTQSITQWAGIGSPVEEQAYRNSRQKTATIGGEHNWVQDWNALNPAFGNNGGIGSGLYSRTLTLVGSFTQVYKITAPGGQTFSPKLVPTYGNAGPILFRDISAPGSVINDSKVNTMCVAFAVDQCITGSSLGDYYINVHAPWDPGLYTSNTVTQRSPGVFQLSAFMGYATQRQVVPFDTTENSVKSTTRLFLAPGQHFSFQSWDPTPDATWGIGISQPAFAGQTWWMFKLPSWGNADTVNRNTFVPVNIHVFGDTARILFGYAENGDPTVTPFCNVYAEACYTSSAATASNPYVFASETQHYTTCTSGCDISVPAIPGRILFYRVERKNGSFVSLSELRSVAVP